MNAILENATFFVLFLTILIVTTRGLLQIKKMGLFETFYIITYLCLLSVPVLILLQKVLEVDYQFILRIALGTMLFSNMCLGIIGMIKEPDQKKLKTLLRFPLIGLLLTWLVTPDQFALVFVIIELIQIAIFYKFKSEQYYIFRQQLKVFSGLLLMLLVINKYYWAFYLGFTIYVVMKNQILNAVKLKNSIYEQQRKIYV
jgi:hypothetical protein